ncbi:MAG: radical SAM protein, partial [Planctomycetota bacterium]
MDAVFEVDGYGYLRVDELGRWQGVGRLGTFFRRTVDGRVVRRERASWAVCGERRTTAAHRLAREMARALRRRMQAQPPSGDHADLVDRLERAVTWSPARLRDETARARRAYPEPVEVLPPHRYRDLVLQPATGCPNHACSFCAFYRDRPFRVQSEAAFDRHLEAVQRALGRSAFARSGLFFGSGSAASLTDEILLARLARVREVFGVPRRGVAAFLDPDHAPARGPEAWERLARAGLVDLTLGLETALPSLREAAGKNGDLTRFLDVTVAVKAAALRVALTVLVGLGGREHEESHRSRTCAWIAGLPLDASDTVYLSPLAGADEGAGAKTDLEAWRKRLR